MCHRQLARVSSLSDTDGLQLPAKATTAYEGKITVAMQAASRPMRPECAVAGVMLRSPALSCLRQRAKGSVCRVRACSVLVRAADGDKPVVFVAGGTGRTGELTCQSAHVHNCLMKLVTI